MATLITRPVRRLFAFGCSFTNYQSTTWPEILAEHLHIPFFNFGQGGTGNLFTFNQIMMADNYYKITDDDLVIVCWSNIYRIDSFQKSWHRQGNLNFEKNAKEFDLEYFGVRDLTFMTLVKNFLTAKACQWHFLSMCDFDCNLKFPDTDLYLQDILDIVQPSFYYVLWQNNLDNKAELNRKKYGPRLIELHPSPIEHYTYLCKIFGNIFSTKLKLQVYELEKNYVNFWMRCLNDSDKEEVGFHTIPLSQHEVLKQCTTLRQPENYIWWSPHYA